MTQHEWRSPETAPKNATIILADFGWPWAVPTVWDEHGQEWVTVMLQACLMENGLTNTYFEIEYEKESNLKRWQPMPVL